MSTHYDISQLAATSMDDWPDELLQNVADTLRILRQNSAEHWCLGALNDSDLAALKILELRGQLRVSIDGDDVWVEGMWR